MVWKMIFLSQGCILMFHVNLPGCKMMFWTCTKFLSLPKDNNQKQIWMITASPHDPTKCSFPKNSWTQKGWSFVENPSTAECHQLERSSSPYISVDCPKSTWESSLEGGFLGPKTSEIRHPPVDASDISAIFKLKKHHGIYTPVTNMAGKWTMNEDVFLNQKKGNMSIAIGMFSERGIFQLPSHQLTPSYFV